MMKNDFLNNYKEGQLRPCQLKQLEILKVFDAICKKYNLKYWIDGGTLLGAVRHGGFIPWDDDLDVAMPSDDFKKFNEVALRELPDNLFWQTKKTDPSTPHDIAKIRDLNSFYVEFLDDFVLPYKKGIFIDVFEIVDYPKVPSRLIEFLLKKTSRSRANLKKKRNLKFRSLIEIPYFLSIYCLLQPILSLFLLFKSKERFSYLPFLNTGGWVYLRRDIFPLSTIEFEGVKFPAPKYPSIVLSTLYGDYMTLPPVDKRQIHAMYINVNLQF